MLKKEILKGDMSKTEVEAFLKGKGDFVQIDHLIRFMKEDLPTDIKKFVSMKIAEIYERRGMYNDAGKLYNNAVIYSIPFSEKMRCHVKEAEMYIKAGLFERADKSLRDAISHSNSREKDEINSQIKDFYKRQALVYEKEMRRGHAVRIYEKLLQMSITEDERREIKEKLMNLYEKVGKVREYLVLKRGFE